MLDSGAVSRQHAQIHRINDNFYIEDMQSRNGTYVNGRQIRERYRLSDQDRLTLCDVVLVFHDDAAKRNCKFAAHSRDHGLDGQRAGPRGIIPPS